jgi:hypothetical protein
MIWLKIPVLRKSRAAIKKKVVAFNFYSFYIENMNTDLKNAPVSLTPCNSWRSLVHILRTKRHAFLSLFLAGGS